MVGTKLEYESGSFVAVNAVLDDSHTSIWIGKVLSTILEESGNINKLRVHWFETRSAAKQSSGRYLPSFSHDSEGKTRGSAWTDEISTDAVMVSFPKLKINDQLPINVIKLVSREGYSSTIVWEPESTVYAKVKTCWSSV